MSIINENLVLSKNNQPVTTSRKVAKYFNKTHSDVMKAINKLICGVRKSSDPYRMFIESTITKDHQQFPIYYMNRDGFSLLVMGFNNTPKVLNWKIKFIHAFDWMENKLKSRTIKLPSRTEALKIAYQQSKRADQQLLISYKQQKQIRHLTPLAKLGQIVRSAKTNITVHQMAKLLDQFGFKTGAYRLYRWLRYIGLVCKSKMMRNIPTQYALKLGLLKSRTRRFCKNGNIYLYYRTVVTPKGQQYIVNHLIK